MTLIINKTIKFKQKNGAIRMARIVCDHKVNNLIVVECTDGYRFLVNETEVINN